MNDKYIKNEDVLLKEKSKKEKEIRKLEIHLSNLIAKRNFLKPRIKKRVFKEDKHEVISVSRIQKAEDLNEEIISLKERINETKKEL